MDHSILALIKDAPIDDDVLFVALVASRNQLEEGLILPRNLDRLSKTFDISKYQRILGAFQMGKICPHDESTQHLEDNLCDQLVLNPHFRKVGRYPYYFQ